MIARRDFLTVSAALALALPASRLLAYPDPAAMPTTNDGRHDFDFFHGHWRVANRRLRARHVGSTQWDEFEARIDCRPLLDGLGNIDEYRSAEVHGLTLRLFDPAKRQWSDQWASKRDGVLGRPAFGAFADGVGRFIGPDEDNGRPILSRALWTQITANAFVWEQAASLDDGQTWETNWVMHMAREG